MKESTVKSQVEDGLDIDDEGTDEDVGAVETPVRDTTPCISNFSPLLRNIAVSTAGKSELLNPTCASNANTTVKTMISNDSDFSTDNCLVQKRKQLAKLFTKYKKEHDLIVNYKTEIEFLDQEIKAVTTLLNTLQLDEKALEDVRQQQLKQLETLLSTDNEAIVSNVKNREPILYRKLIKSNTVGELKTMMSLMRNRQTALKHLELLIFKKVINLNSEAKQKPKLLRKPAFVASSSKSDSLEKLLDLSMGKKAGVKCFAPLPWPWDASSSSVTGSPTWAKWTPGLHRAFDPTDK